MGIIVDRYIFPINTQNEFVFCLIRSKFHVPMNVRVPIEPCCQRTNKTMLQILSTAAAAN